MDTDCFAKAIEEEIASIETERRRAREAQALERENRDAACRTALRVRAEVILPLLDGFRDAFAKGKMLPRWEVASEGGIDKFSATCRSCSANPGDLSFRIKAEVAVQENGTKLGFSVVCECEDPLKTSESKTSELGKAGGYSVNMTGFNMTDAHRWYYNELEKCAVACVREKLKQAV
jgi:hypothetical protein